MGMSVKECLTSIADSIRNLRENGFKMSLESMVDDMETVVSEVYSQSELIDDILEVIDSKSSSTSVSLVLDTVVATIEYYDTANNAISKIWYSTVENGNVVSRIIENPTLDENNRIQLITTKWSPVIIEFSYENNQWPFIEYNCQFLFSDTCRHAIFWYDSGSVQYSS